MNQLSTIQVGWPAPDVAVSFLDGRPARLSAFWGSGRSALLIFLRHLAWLPCRDHVVQVVAHHEEFQARQANVVTISFGPPRWAAVWLQETQSPFPFLLDASRTAYEAYGLKASARSAWSLPTLRYYFQAVLRGEKLLGNRGDVSQLGGDFIVDQTGLIRLAHPSREPTDRPAIEELMRTLGRL